VWESRTPGSVRGDRGNPVPYRVIVKGLGRATPARQIPPAELSLPSRWWARRKDAAIVVSARRTGIRF
jgi:hypothetical protein